MPSERWTQFTDEELVYLESVMRAAPASYASGTNILMPTGSDLLSGIRNEIEHRGISLKRYYVTITSSGFQYSPSPVELKESEVIMFRQNSPV